MIEIVLRGRGKNALGTSLMTELCQELERAQNSPVLLRGDAGCFSSGLDLKEVSELSPDEMRRFLALLEDLTLELFLHPAPTVAWVNGHAIAGGCVLALCCDHRVASDDTRTRIGLNEVALGVRFPPRVMALAKYRVPRHAIERVLLGAELHDPAQALKLGLVDELCADAERVAKERLAALAEHPREAYAAAKRSLRAGVLEPTADERSRFEREDLPVWTSEAVRARIRAIFKR